MNLSEFFDKERRTNLKIEVNTLKHFRFSSVVLAGVDSSSSSSSCNIIQSIEMVKGKTVKADQLAKEMEYFFFGFYAG